MKEFLIKDDLEKLKMIDDRRRVEGHALWYIRVNHCLGKLYTTSKWWFESQVLCSGFFPANASWERADDGEIR